MTTPLRLQPLTTAAAPARARHRDLIAELRTWALARGTPTDTDLAAVVLDAAGDLSEPWTRPRVTTLLRCHVPNWCSLAGCLRPEGESAAIWLVLHFLADTGRLPDGSDALDHLTEPLRCYPGGLGENGRPRPDGEHPPFPCQCYIDVAPASRPGLSRWIVGFDTVIELWRPTPREPRLEDWWHPFAEFSRQVRTQDYYWLLHMEDFHVVGRTDPIPGAPSLWVYHHDDAGGELFVDDDGAPYGLKLDRRRRFGYRFEPVDVRTAVWRTGWPQLECSRRAPRDAQADEDDRTVVPLWR